MKSKLAIFLIILLGLIPLHSEELENEEFEKREHGIPVEYEPKYVPPADTKGNKRISTYKIDMLKGIPDKNDIFDITEYYYNDPGKADLFLEAHFNKYDNPNIDPGIRINLPREYYNKNKELYREIRNKKLILTSTTAIFRKYSDTNEYPTGGLLTRKDYNYSKEEFDRLFDEEEILSKYRWRIKGNHHYCPNILVEGRIRLSVPRKFARDLTGDSFFYKVKRATIMGIFRIKDKTNSYITIEPVRYMLIWRKKKKIFTNFTASLDPAEMEKASIANMQNNEDDFGDAADDDFDETSGDDSGDDTHKTNSGEKIQGSPSKKSQKKSNDDFVDEFGDFSEEE